MTRVAFLTLGLLVLLLPGRAPLHGQEGEEILDYDVTIAVHDGGVMDVREEIRVRVLGQRIRRGIFRDVPTSFPRSSGLGRIEAPFEVTAVTRNGSPEPYSLEAIGGPMGRSGMRVRIGDADVLLEHGIHEYAVEYRTSRWVDFGDERDRLYWNVTGNGWAFPIRSATARISVDGLTTAPELESWTGPEGSTAGDATAAWDPATTAADFRTLQPLGPEEGLTVRMTFPGGMLAPPTESQTAEWVRLDWGGWIDAGYVVLFVVAVYLLMWRRVGMDPPARRAGLSSEPPEGYSPAALGFIEDRGYEQTQVSAALVDMALKGAIRIEQDDDTWTIEKLAEPESLQERLAPEEVALFAELLGGRDRIRLSRTHHETLRAAIKAFRSSLARRLEREYFENNRLWFGIGLAVSVVGFAALAWRWRFDINPVALFLGVWLTGWSFGVGTLAYRLVHQVRAARRGGGPVLWAGAGFLALFSIPFFAAEIVVTGLLFTMVPVHIVAAAIAIGLTNVLFYHLLERPTLKGRGVLDRLDGFRTYLEGTAGATERITPGPPDRIRVYERFLPFAIALGLADRWTDGFEDVLTSALAAGAAGHHLPWYHPSGTTLDPSRLASDLGTGLGSTLSSMSSAPSSSSGGGFSGGGSSGGGGGGGGGGGW